MSHTPHPDRDAVSVSCAVLTVSDTRTPDTDKSGQLIQANLTAANHRVAAYQILKDEPKYVRQYLQEVVSAPAIQVVLVNGGTGISPRDTTYEEIAPLLTKPLPGFGGLLRLLSYEEIGSRAMASRAMAGLC